MSAEPYCPLPADPEPAYRECAACGEPIAWDEVWVLERGNEGLYLHAQPCFQELLDETAASC